MEAALVVAAFVLAGGISVGIGAWMRRRVQGVRQIAAELARAVLEETATRLALTRTEVHELDVWRPELLRVSGEYRGRAVAVEVKFCDMYGYRNLTVVYRTMVLVGPAGEPAPYTVGFGSPASLKYGCNAWLSDRPGATLGAECDALLCRLAECVDELELDGRWLRVAPKASPAGLIAGAGEEYHLLTTANELVQWLDAAIDIHHKVVRG